MLRIAPSVDGVVSETIPSSVPLRCEEHQLGYDFTMISSLDLCTRFRWVCHGVDAESTRPLQCGRMGIVLGTRRSRSRPHTHGHQVDYLSYFFISLSFQQARGWSAVGRTSNVVHCPDVASVIEGCISHSQRHHWCLYFENAKNKRGWKTGFGQHHHRTKNGESSGRYQASYSSYPCMKNTDWLSYICRCAV